MQATSHCLIRHMQLQACTHGQAIRQSPAPELQGLVCADPYLISVSVPCCWAEMLHESCSTCLRHVRCNANHTMFRTRRATPPPTHTLNWSKPSSAYLLIPAHP
eukprot:365865-Chlamydomonas_euryale.AAC.8